jgi:hypothetical protein
MILFALLQTTAAANLPLAGDSLIVRLHNDPSSDVQIWLPVFVALAVVGIGSLVQLYVANRQMTTQRELTERQIVASLRSTARLKWIDELRSLLAKFATESNQYMMVLAEITIAEQAGKETESFTGRSNRQLRRTTTIVHRLELHLDPYNESEKALMSGVRAYARHLGGHDDRVDDLDAYADRLKLLRKEMNEAAWVVIREHSDRAGRGL